MSMTEQTILPHFFIVLIDETLNWLDADLVDRCGGSIKAAYFFNSNRHVRCAEWTPSFELHFLESAPGDFRECPQGPFFTEEMGRMIQDAWEEEREVVETMLVDGDRETPEVAYFHTTAINLDRRIDVWKFTEAEWQEVFDDADGDEETAYDAAVEAVREHVGANGYY